MSEFVESRPQRLCLMCGICCRVATAPHSHEKLLELARNPEAGGDESAREFLSIFEPYPSIDDARKVSAPTVDNILKHMQDSGLYSHEVTFYRCKHIQDNNLCGIYGHRPELCSRAPSTAWAVFPPGCGFQGWLFQKREEIKQKIRKQKEYLVSFETELKTVQDPEIISKLENSIEKIKETIEYFAKYGSKDW